MNAICLAVLVTLFSPDATNRVVETVDSKLYYGYTGITAESLRLRDALQTVNINTDCVTDYGRQATMVSSNMAIGCKYYTYAVGQSISFGGNVSTVTEVVPGLDDVSYIYFDPPITDVEPMLVAPKNWYECLELKGVFISSYNVPVSIVDVDGNIIHTTLFSRGQTQKYLLATGDSGSPVFFVVEDRPVFIGTAISTAGQFAQPLELEIERGFYTERKGVIAPR
jgi:hypothetical protein